MSAAEIFVLCLGFILAITLAIYATCGKFSVVEETVPFSNPPLRGFKVYGRWPNNLICYGNFDTREEAEQWAKKADAP